MNKLSNDYVAAYNFFNYLDFLFENEASKADLIVESKALIKKEVDVITIEKHIMTLI